MIEFFQETLRDYTWLLLLVGSAPLVALAWGRRIFPHTTFVAAALLPVALAFVIVVVPRMYYGVLLIDGLLVALAGLDLLTLPWGGKTFSAQREALRVASLQGTHKVTLTVVNHSRRGFALTVRDDLPDSMLPDPEEFQIQLAGRRRARLPYTFRPLERGAFEAECVHLRVRSRLGFWSRLLRVPAATTFHVYPDMKQLSKYAVLARTNRLSLMGLRRTRRIGQDNEFERLRDYTLDDNYKHIEWRTTARRQKLTVKDFQTSQSQRIIFMLDCGRMMTNHADGLSLLDHALNAMLMLSYVALRQGDSVGLLCFSDRIHSFTPPRGGMNQMNHLLHASFDRFPELVESRYDSAFLYLASHCHKRSLVILISNVIDEVNSLQLQTYMGNLVGRHLPLSVLLRDRHLFEAADTETPQELFRAAAAADILNWRHQVLVDLEHKGVLHVDVYPEDMTAQLVNRYLEIKARHLL